MNNYFLLLVDMITYCKNVLLFTCTTLSIYNYKIYYFRWQLPHKRRSYPDMSYSMLKTTYYITKWQSFATSLSLPPQKPDSQESGSLTVHPVRGFANTQIFAIEIRKTYVTIKYLLKQYEFWKSIYTKDLCNLNLHQLGF